MFDFENHLGSNTNNIGHAGPGNNFTTNLPGWYGGTDPIVTPFYATGVEELLPHEIARAKGMISKNFIGEPIIPKNDRLATIGKNTQGRARYESIMSEDFDGFHSIGDVSEVVLPRNTGIKSWFPSPDRFILNDDGTVSLTPIDWNDPRVDFKNGGKLNNTHHK